MNQHSTRALRQRACATTASGSRALRARQAWHPRWAVCWFAAVGCVLGCSPNLVVGSRELDAALSDAQEPVVQRDAGPAADARVAQDAGILRDAASAPPIEADANGDNETQGDGAVVCTSNEQCPEADEPLCQLSEGRCVECLGDADCDPSERCEDDGECSARPISCTSALQCAGNEASVCHPMLQICVECASDLDCPRSETCQPNNECD